MTPKQEAFVHEYLLDLNATQAAIRAGYSPDTAGAIGFENLKKPEIAAAVERAKKERNERTQITSDYVLVGIKEIAERCLQRVPVMRGRGENAEQVVDDEGRHIWTFDAAGANKAFENLGKHLKLFTDKVEHSGGQSLTILTGVPRAD